MEQESIIEPSNCDLLISGQRILIASVMMYISLGLLSRSLETALLAGLFIILVLFAIKGMKTIIEASSFGNLMKSILYLSIIIPPFGIISLFYLNGLATEQLRKEGYAVGILGVRR